MSNILRLVPRPRAGTVVLLGVALAAGALVAAAAPALAHDGEHADEAPGTLAAGVGAVPRDDAVRGLVYRGLERAVDGPCRGLYRVTFTSLCSHGPDAAPEGVDVSRSAEPIAELAPLPATSPKVQCDGAGTSGKRTQVLYVRASDRADRYATFLTSFRQWAADADRIYRNSATKTGGERHIRFVHDASCVLTIPNVVIPAAADDTFGDTQAALAALGYNRTDRKYMLFVDANVYCGIGNIRNDDSPGAANLNNGGPSYGRTDAGCWGGSVAAHEHMHNIGGVQLSAPHASGGWHCVDEYDRMCYSDTPNFPVMQILCPDTDQDRLFDCRNDDYYNTKPLAGSYLATHWNAANSQYLVAGAQPLWGFVWASDPTAASYTPSLAYQRNSTGAQNTIERTGVGTYVVTFPNLGVNQGTVNVTAYGSTSESCKVVSWGAFYADQRVNVRCFNSAGAAADSRFTASYARPVGNPGPFAYVWANNPSTASYTPSASYRFNSTGGVNTITRTGVGFYEVHLPGLGASNGTVKVTAYGSGSEACNVVFWSPLGTEQVVRVICKNTAGVNVDTRFTMTFANRLSILGAPGAPNAFVWADQPATASYTPSASYQYDSAGGSITAKRTSVGVYSVTLPGLGGGLLNPSGHVQVTSYGSGLAECKVASWSTAISSSTANVRCFDTLGAPIDSRYTLQYTR